MASFLVCFSNRVFSLSVKYIWYQTVVLHDDGDDDDDDGDGDDDDVGYIQLAVSYV